MSSAPAYFWYAYHGFGALLANQEHPSPGALQFGIKFAYISLVGQSGQAVDLRFYDALEMGRAALPRLADDRGPKWHDH